LIREFCIVKNLVAGKSLKLLIAGHGSQEKYLKILVNKLKIERDNIFTGYISHD